MERHKRYNGKVTLMYDDGPHTYEVEGMEDALFPSVTKITDILDKPALRHWYVNRSINYIQESIRPGVPYDEIQLKEVFKDAKWGGARARDHAATIGRDIHDWIERYITEQIATGKRPEAIHLPIHTGMRDSINKFLAWEQEADPQYLMSEYRNVSLNHMFSGTLDIVYRDSGGDLVVADIKTGKRVYPEHFLQTAGYCVMLEEEKPPLIVDDEFRGFSRIIIHIPLVGKLNVKWPKNGLNEDARVFLGLVDTYHWKENQ